ncbi:protein S40-7-like [Salvia miltiorrhiza]|uniref:protein S40-7-like n=1 Tax=Salvia miltiorrhiza TaxID=226208 RepID=UPI0025AB6EBB|nr:protein S40-7-like [Salvia miltiorrhiza]
MQMQVTFLPSRYYSYFIRLHYATLSASRKMDPTFAVGYRHRRSPSSDRFISVFYPPSSASTADVSSFSSAGGDELSEVDVFYTSDFSDDSRGSRSGTSEHLFRRSVHQPEKFGILAALPEDRRKTDVVVQKPALSSPPTTSFSRDIPAIPKPHFPSEAKFSQSMPVRRFQQSAPMNVPMMPRKARNKEAAFVDGGDEAEEEEEEVLPPHEMVARVSLRNQKTTFSVLEGVGRTLKGRDLRQVRNAVWRQTGFLD